MRKNLLLLLFVSFLHFLTIKVSGVYFHTILYRNIKEIHAIFRAYCLRIEKILCKPKKTDNFRYIPKMNVEIVPFGHREKMILSGTQKNDIFGYQFYI